MGSNDKVAQKVPSVALIEFLMRVRPAQLASVLKAVLRIRRTPVDAATGCRYWVDPVSTFGADLIKTGVYEPSMTLLVQKLVRPGDTFLDVGANEGYFSCLAAKAGGSVVAIEPQSRLGPVLVENIRLNRLDNVRVVRQGIGDRDGVMTLHLRPGTNTGASSMFRHWRLGWTTEEVPITSMDAFFKAQGLGEVRLMKVDCEGAEKMLFSAAAKVLASRVVEYIALEYHPTIIGVEACRAIHGRITAAGYSIREWLGLTVYLRPGAEEQFGASSDASTLDWLA